MSEWIPICKAEGESPIEIETEEDGTLLLENVTAHFPGTTTLKFKNPETGTFRAIKCSSGVMKPPGGGWDQVSLYYCVLPVQPEPAVQIKRRIEEVTGEVKKSRFSPPEADPLATTDLILLGLKPTTTESDIRAYLTKFGELAMVQMKKSKDVNVGYAFVRFNDKTVERQVVKEKHTIDGRECVLRVPDSQQQGDKSLRKVYISYHNKILTEADFREHFEQFGDVMDVFIPDPWRHFAFVTFAEQRVASALIGLEHNLKGVSLLIKSAANVKGKQQPSYNSPEDFIGHDGMGQMGAYGYGGMQWGGHMQGGGPDNWNNFPGPSMGSMPPNGGGGGGGFGMGPVGDKMAGNGGGMMGGGGSGGGWQGSAGYGYGPVPPQQQQQQQHNMMKLKVVN